MLSSRFSLTDSNIRAEIRWLAKELLLNPAEPAWHSLEFLVRKVAVEAPRLLQEQLEELSQINTELLRRGEPLVVLEAMKMQNDIVAPADGAVKQVLVVSGEQVAKGQLLIELAEIPAPGLP